ncbi:hypothetical protein C8R46DRAFT_1214738 [Mycena filopes]|nr:hypothetical protein C8R46DRAFT_1214738 [Mycena filopes]
MSQTSHPFSVSLSAADNHIVAYIGGRHLPKVSDGTLAGELRVIQEFYDIMQGQPNMGAFVVKTAHHSTTGGTSFARGGLGTIQGDWKCSQPGPIPIEPIPPNEPKPFIPEEFVDQMLYEWKHPTPWQAVPPLQQSFNRWSNYESQLARYKKEVKKHKIQMNEYNRWNRLLRGNRPHISMVITLSTDTTHLAYRDAFHLYSRNDRPADGLETYTFTQTTGGPTYMNDRAQYVDQAFRNHLGVWRV